MRIVSVYMNYLSSVEGLSCVYSNRKNHRVEKTKLICCEGDKKYAYIRAIKEWGTVYTERSG